MPTARTISWLDQSFETKPEAPAALAALFEMRPAPEMSSTRGAGCSWRRRSQISAPDSSPTNRSTSATRGSKRRGGPIASSIERALRQRVTQGCWLKSRRKPQWTTSWSSTISTPTLFPPGSKPFSLIVDRHHQADLPAAFVAGAELDHAAQLERLEGGQTQTHAGGPVRAARGHAVVCDLEDEGAVLAVGANGDVRGLGMLARVPQRFREHGLG